MTTAGISESAGPASSGFRTFVLIWLGQMVSMLGSGLTSFALGVWIYQRTGSATSFALLTFFVIVPAMLVLPLAGVLVDRWDRRRVMMASDSLAALGTLALALLVWSGRLETWHIYAVVVFNSAVSSLQMPAFSATVPLLVAKRHLGRTAGMMQLGAAVPTILAPLVAGALVAVIGLHGILIVDLVTFLFAVSMLFIVRLPNPPRGGVEDAAGAEQGPVSRDALYGWTYLRERPGLLALLFMFAGVNFCLGFLNALLTPMILSFASEKALGTVMALAGCGMLVGGVAMAVWGGPKRRMQGVFGFLLLAAVILSLSGLRENVTLIAAAAFAFLCCFPLINGCAAAILQTKIAPQVLGRAMAAQQLVAMSALPVAILLAGPLADHVFEPLLAPGGPLAGTVGRVIGVGPGRGIGLLFMVLGGLIVLAVAAGWANPRVRNLEDELPDAIGDEPPPVSPLGPAPQEPAPGSL
ncbi:MAG TPA: MFS transporter [Thermoanaerobaculia bacterium]|nr:MFS transporter [Thermoanaerobaculia bacterium]